MDFPIIQMNKNKRIGNVLFVVEGERTEPYILCRIFEKIFGYHYTRIYRNGKKPYDKLSSNNDKNSRVYVINAEESSITHISSTNQYLDNVFKTLIEDYNLNFENMAIYYIWDRDCYSNTDIALITGLINSLVNSRDSDSYDRQGLLLISYPAIESYIASGFIKNCFNIRFAKGKEVKQFLHHGKINLQDIDENSIIKAAIQLMDVLQIINAIPNLDNMRNSNLSVFNYQENGFLNDKAYWLLSLFSIALLDLGLISE